MQHHGNLLKMESALEGHEVFYTLWLNEKPVEMNALLDKQIRFVFQGQINCVSCGKITRKSFGQGFCYQCFTTSPLAEECVLKPQLCRAHLGIARDINWAQEHCLQPHYVYLANTGNLKVGVTRRSQIPTRWIDQGASSAIKLCQTPNRHIAGIIETYLMQFYKDKTSWRRMVTNEEPSSIDLVNAKKEALALLPGELQQYALDDNTLFLAQYPVLQWPQNPVQINLDNDAEIDGTLKGIKGQYLFFDRERILNIRRFSGYLIDLTSY